MNQPSLFDMPGKKMPDTAPYSNDTTSKEAAKKIEYKLTGARKKVYDYIKSRGPQGATGSEIAEATAMLLYTAKPRCTELRNAEYIRDSGKVRPNKMGSNEIVWIDAAL